MVKRNHDSCTIYMEGGGDAKILKTALARGMESFLKNAGFDGKMPSIVACGGRNQALDRFQIAVANGKNALLLVDSEWPVDVKHINLPWDHLKLRDDWEKPENVTDEQCHLMVQCMESWFLADVDSVAKYFGQGFTDKHFPAQGDGIETIPKKQVYQKLELATKDCGKDKDKNRGSKIYDKGRDSFKILGLINPEKVKTASQWAKRFFETLKKYCDK